MAFLEDLAIKTASLQGATDEYFSFAVLSNALFRLCYRDMGPGGPDGGGGAGGGGGGRALEAEEEEGGAGHGGEVGTSWRDKTTEHYKTN